MSKRLFEMIELGTKVTVIDQPIKLGWIDGELFIEAHPTQEQSDHLEAHGRFRTTIGQRVGRPRFLRSLGTIVAAWIGARSGRSRWNGVDILYRSLARSQPL